MFCRKCDNEINDDALLCNKCGEKVSVSAELPKAEPASAVMTDTPIRSGGTAVKKGINKKILIGSIIGVVVAVTAVILIMFFTRTKTVDGRFPIEDGKVHIKLPTEITVSWYTSSKGNGKPKRVKQYIYEYNEKGLMSQHWKVSDGQERGKTYYDYDDEGNMIGREKEDDSVYYVNKQGILLGVDETGFKYDENKRLKKIITSSRKGYHETTFSYKENGKINSVLDEDDDGYVFNYDDNKVTNMYYQDDGKKSDKQIKYKYKEDKLTNVEAKGKETVQEDIKCNDDGYITEIMYYEPHSSFKLEFKYEDPLY